jgi:hypothetical protein
MSLRDFFHERALLLVLATILVLFLAIGVFFRAPELRLKGLRDDAMKSPTYEHLGLNDAALDHHLELPMPGILKDWNNQKLIGH